MQTKEIDLKYPVCKVGYSRLFAYVKNTYCGTTQEILLHSPRSASSGELVPFKNGASWMTCYELEPGC